MKSIIKTTALAAMFALAGTAHAAQYLGSTGSAATVDSSFASASQLFFDLDFSSHGSVTLNFSVDADDLANPLLSFNALVRNLSGAGFDTLQLSLAGASFALPAGTVTTDGFQPVLASGSDAQGLWASFGQPGVTTEFYIGNPLLQAGAADWSLNLAGRQLGDGFSITVAVPVPEPETYALMLAGLAGVASIVRRRRRA